MKKDYMQSADVLGTRVELRLSTDNLILAEKWFTKLWDEIAKFDENFSRFKNGSELSKFNQNAGKRVKISEEFELILRTAKKFSEITEGVFNPFILPYLQKSGYVHSMTNANHGPDYSSRMFALWCSLEISKGSARIPADTAIDLGGIGKGFLADKLASMIQNEIPDFCLSLGGDMRIGGKNSAGVWKIEVEAPQKNQNGTKPQILFSKEEEMWGIATSGATREKFDRKQNHLINPKTGTPIVTSALCTVVAKNATAADVLASCVLIEGKELALVLYKQGEIDGAVIQEEGGDSFVLGNGFTGINEKINLRNNFPAYV